MAFRANRSQVAVGLRIAFNLPEPSILYRSEYATTIPAPVAEGWDARDRRLCACMSPLLKIKKLLA
jgi:hypothetical protein